MALSASKEHEAKSASGADWRDTKTAEQCLAHLCLSENLSDIKFIIGHVRLPAHKFILSMRSAIFEAMFNGPLTEKGDTVLIEDVDPETMKTLLRFVYTDKPELNGNNILSSLHAANKFGLTGLVKQCSEFLESSIDKDNVCSIHEQVVLYDMEPLREICFDYILENASDVFATKGFLKISHQTLFKLLKDDTLSAEEIDIFNAALRWAQEKCKVEKLQKTAKYERKILDKVLFEIRFPIMPIAEFARVVTPTGILTNDEQVMLYQFIATQGSSPLSRFNKKIRSRETVTVDLTKHINVHYHSDLQGFYLHFSDLEYNEYAEMSFNRPSLKVKSVNGTFVKHVKRVTVKNNQVVNYETVGTEIVLQTPIEIGHGDTIQFHPSDKESSSYQRQSRCCNSHHVNIHKNINGQLVNFMLVPLGLEKISFAKK